MTKDLMLTVLKTGKTAKDLWNHLKRLFQDNKGNRAASLESKFVNLKFIDCNNVDDYCDKLQALSNRLSDLEFPMDEKRLVIQLVNGLPEEYNTVASFIQQSMPSFDTARSQLRTEDIRREHQSTSNTHAALAAGTPHTSHHLPVAAHRHQQSPFFSTEKSPHSLDRTEPLLPNPTGPLLSHQQPTTGSNRIPLLPNPASPFPPYPHWASPWNAAPPANRGRGRQNRGRGRGRGRHPTAGRSPQAYIVPTTDYLQPSDIAEVYSSMSIRTPDDDFYMDTGATSHITSDPGTLQKVFNSSNVRSILVGNGNSIPDLSSRKTILRCDSSGELYPITTSAVQSSFSPPPHQYSLAVCSPTIWHSRLGHPGKAVLDALRTKSFIQCNKEI
ncbi:uncharacterized protein LOC113328305 [Papaver somniferum]|uniref:uncharacterized protein LOC113328305 n=1 Tax=Papaver somniferum TaxID=3469 RepID=UPI000E704304|nr:uncharacterized protein LOC113328305 [Papaver somniferum]